MEWKILRDNTELKVQVKAPVQGKAYNSIKSEEMIFNDTLKVSFRHISYYNNTQSYCYDNIVFIKIETSDQDDQCTYRTKPTCPEFNIKESILYPSQFWQVINENKNASSYKFTVTVHYDTVMQRNFSALHDDEVLTDFKLKANDGEVAIHKALLAAFSKKFKADLVKDDENLLSLEIPETSVRTLQDFKKFIYTEELPDENLEELLLLASYFEVDWLEYKCVDKMMKEIKTGNAIKLLEFALQQKHMLLFLGIMDCVQSGEIKISDIRKCYLYKNNTIKK